MSRLAKQLLFGSIYLSILLSMGWFFYRTNVPAPVCTDGIQNGREEGVDCGPVCGRSCPPPVKPLEGSPVLLLQNSDGSWDALVHLENRNGTYGAARVDYKLVVVDVPGKELVVRRGRTYVNPAQPRYLIFPLGTMPVTPARAELQFFPGEVEWAALTVEAAGAVEFTVRNDVLSPHAGGLRYEALAVNRSQFDFDEVDATVLLQDAAGKVVAGGSTVMKTVRAGEGRAFVVDWPFAVPEAVRARAFVATNLFANENYLRSYGSQEQFQGY